MSKLNKNIVYFDYNKTKKLTDKGGLKQLINNDALEQALKIWISSQKGEKIRTTGGGLLFPYIGKTLDDLNAEKMKQALLKGLEESFQPNITVVELKVIPNKEKNRWEIYIVGYNLELSLGVNTLVLINNRV